MALQVLAARKGSLRDYEKHKISGFGGEFWPGFVVCVPSQAAAVKVSVQKQGDRSGSCCAMASRTFVKGAGGDGSKPLLREYGGNSFRTWGADGSAIEAR